jgi:hypothetical protein
MAVERQVIVVDREEVDLTKNSKLPLSKDSISRITALCLFVLITGYLFGAYFGDFFPLKGYKEKKESGTKSPVMMT